MFSHYFTFWEYIFVQMENASLREELVNAIHMDPVHSDASNPEKSSRSVSRTHPPIILDISDNQETVKEVSSSRRLSVLDVFSHDHGN